MARDLTCNIGLPEWVLIAAFRYSIGRPGEILDDVVELLVEMWPRLSESTRLVIENDIRTQLRATKAAAGYSLESGCLANTLIDLRKRLKEE